jgi:hypothetical protein
MTGRILILAPAAALALWCSGSVRAADVPAKPPPLVVVGTEGAPSGGCSTCAGPAVGSCNNGACGRHMISLHHHSKEPFVVNLCPGACFGYFQTQWRKWDEVCPYPYQGVGVGDAPRPALPIPTEKFPKKDGALPEPRPVDPKMKDPKLPPPPPVSGLPPIPIIGTNGRP